MRITLDEKYGGRLINTAHEMFDVYLNGERLTCCILADDEEGVVVAAEKDANGRLIVNDGMVQRKEMRGHVIIEAIRQNQHLIE